MNNETLIDVLNDLIRINNDRIEGYERAASDIEDSTHAEIKSLFYKMAEDSRGYKRDLIDTVISLGGEAAQDTTTSGKIYRGWMKVKASITANDVKTALESCEFGEDAALKAYQEALETEVEWPATVANLVSGQRLELRMSHDRIKRYRDEFRAVDELEL